MSKQQQHRRTSFGRPAVIENAWSARRAIRERAPAPAVRRRLCSVAIARALGLTRGDVLAMVRAGAPCDRHDQRYWFDLAELRRWLEPVRVELPEPLDVY